MSTCKDCIHAEKCRDYLAYKLDKALDGINGSEKTICEFFIDKSKFIELPCEVGDYVYCLNGKGQIRQFKIRCVKTSQSDINANPKNVVLTLGCNNTVGLLWFDSDKTKNIYFSKEQAEQALKERE